RQDGQRPGVGGHGTVPSRRESLIGGGLEGFHGDTRFRVGIPDGHPENVVDVQKTVGGDAAILPDEVLFQTAPKFPAFSDVERLFVQVEKDVDAGHVSYIAKATHPPADSSNNFLISSFRSFETGGLRWDSLAAVFQSFAFTALTKLGNPLT